MNYCNECGCEFEEPKKVYEHHSELNGMGGVTYETFYVCPFCGSDDYEEEEKCELCGKEYPRLIYKAEKDICTDCFTQLVNIMDDTVMKITGFFDVDSLEAKELITNFYEEVWE